MWRPPPASTLNGEFLGYEMTYRKVSDNDIEGGGGGGEAAAKRMAINEDMLRVQVSTRGAQEREEMVGSVDG